MTRKSKQRRDARRQLGETSDEYGRTVEREPEREMTEGQDLGMETRGLVSESPSGMHEDRPPSTDRGFADDRERRDR